CASADDSQFDYW
nr:immunoglobulin heavy chain junction region [Macaca mulatta]